MANEKSRNHEPRSGDKGGSDKTQGKRESDKQANEVNKKSTRSKSGKPGPGLQLRDQLNVRTKADSQSQ